MLAVALFIIEASADLQPVQLRLDSVRRAYVSQRFVTHYMVTASYDSEAAANILGMFVS